MQKAVALKYKIAEQNAPQVIAKGSGEVAKKIIEKAKLYDIAIFNNESLANSLMKVEIDNSIPPNLYKAVAEVFVWLYNSETKAKLS